MTLPNTRNACKEMTPNGNVIRLLTYAFAAMEHGSLRQAARKLRVRESCVSRNVVRLEQILEMRLFERDAHGVKLTEAGRAWTTSVRAHYEGLREAFDARVPSDEEASTIRVGLSAVTGGEFLKRLFGRLKKFHPGISMTIQDIPAEQCSSAISRRHLDIAFTHDLGAITTCRSEIFWRECLFVLLPPGHPLVTRQAVLWSDLADMQLLVPVGPEGPLLDLRLLDRVSAEGGPAFQLCKASQATVMLKVQLGEGVTLVGENHVMAAASGSAVCRPLGGPHSTSPIKAVWLDSNPKRAVLRLVGVARNMARRAPAANIATSVRHWHR